jgi:hypothetical protein
VDGQLAAAATFVAHARAWRAGRAPKPTYANLTAFRHAHELYFDTPVGLVIPGRERYRPKDVSRWLDWIPRAGPRDLRVGVEGGAIRDEKLSDKARMATFSPFQFTVVDTRGRMTAWVSAREPVTTTQNLRGLWTVHFRHVDVPALAPDLEVDVATRRLQAVILQALDHARTEPRLAQWAGSLERALAVLAGAGSPHGPFDVLPDYGYSDEAMRLVTGVHHAWVLGGEGSWSDYEARSKPDARLHERTMTELYACLIEGMLAAVNGGLDA